MATRRPTPERYNAFISQIELQGLWVVKATLANNVGAKRLDDPTLDIKTSPSYEAAPGGFKATADVYDNGYRGHCYRRGDRSNLRCRV